MFLPLCLLCHLSPAISRLFSVNHEKLAAGSHSKLNQGTNIHRIQSSHLQTLITFTNCPENFLYRKRQGAVVSLRPLHLVFVTLSLLGCRAAAPWSSPSVCVGTLQGNVLIIVENSLNFCLFQASSWLEWVHINLTRVMLCYSRCIETTNTYIFEGF